MGRVKALACPYCKRTTHHERLHTSGSLVLFECRVCFAKKVQQAHPDLGDERRRS